MSFNPEFLGPKPTRGPSYSGRASTRTSDMSDSDNGYDSDEESSFVEDDGASGSDDETAQYKSYLRDDSVVNMQTVSRFTDGRTPTIKRITADLDSDDEVIKSMKDAGYRDEEVQKRMISEGRTKYAVKSITTRYTRILRVCAAREAEDLDNELTDWHEGDDDILDKARKKYNADLEKAINRARDKYWRLVAADVHDQQKTKGQSKIRFSKNACRTRTEERDNGTAKVPFELDPNPAERLAGRNARLEEIGNRKLLLKMKREQQAAEAREKELAQFTKAQQAEMEKMNREELREMRENARQAKIKAREERNQRNREDRARRKAIRADKAQARAKVALFTHVRKSNKKRETQSRRQSKEIQSAQRKMEQEVAKLNADRAAIQANFEKRKAKAELVAHVRNSINDALDENERRSGMVCMGARRIAADDLKDDQRNILGRLIGRPRGIGAPLVPNGDAFSLAGPQPGADDFMLDPPKNPRWEMTLDELRELCVMRGEDVAPDADRRTLVQALMDSDRVNLCKHIKGVLKQRGIAIYGAKMNLILRMANDDAGCLARGSKVHRRLKERVAKRKAGEMLGGGPDGRDDADFHLRKRLRPMPVRKGLLGHWDDADDEDDVGSDGDAQAEAQAKVESDEDMVD